MSSTGLLVVESKNGILRVTINRPEKRNALSRAVLSELHQTFSANAGDNSLRVAVLRGAGDKNFAAGGDLRDLAAVRAPEQATQMSERAKAALDAIRGFPVPVVAALNGDALGGGAELAVACDFRVAASHAKIGFIHGRLNISTAWGGGLDLMNLVGPARALRLLSTSEMLDGTRALAIGLIDAAAEPQQELDSAVAEFIAPLLKQAPQVLRAFKALAIGVRRRLPYEELAALETRRLSETWAHEDHWAVADKVLDLRKEARLGKQKMPPK